MEEFVDATDVGDSENGHFITGKRVQATLYDAVAGRVTSTHALQGDQNPPVKRPHKRTRRAANANPRLRSGQPSHDAVLSPEEVLFRRTNAPTRYAERDFYFANEQLPDGGRDVLPDSDMLKALHVYASHFYAEKYGEDDKSGRQRSTVEGEDELAHEANRKPPLQRVAPIDERSMDETALLAFGILIEEASRELLGESGDLVFTEGVEPDKDTDE